MTHPLSEAGTSVEVKARERIWLEPDCEGNLLRGEGRTWCSDNVFEDCPECGAKATEYVRADLLEAQVSTLSRHLEEAREALTDLLGCTHKPNPTDPTRIDIAPGKHRAFGDAIRRAKETVSHG